MKWEAIYHVRDIPQVETREEIWGIGTPVSWHPPAGTNSGGWALWREALIYGLLYHRPIQGLGVHSASTCRDNGRCPCPDVPLFVICWYLNKNAISFFKIINGYIYTWLLKIEWRMPSSMGSLTANLSSRWHPNQRRYPKRWSWKLM